MYLLEMLTNVIIQQTEHTAIQCSTYTIQYIQLIRPSILKVTVNSHCFHFPVAKMGMLITWVMQNLFHIICDLVASVIFIELRMS